MYTCLHASLLVGFCLHGWVECECHLFFYPPSELEVCIYACAINIPNLAILIWYLPLFCKQPFPSILYGFMVLVHGEYAIYIERIDRISHV